MYACLIIDDPLLKKRYGFLDYKKLLSLMDKYDFHTCIAFIPYNYKRSNSDTIKMFIDRPDRYSLCFHGCDHTEAEFGITDEAELNRKCKLAISRMEKHRERTGIDHDNVIVFPQGVFSTVALRVLKANGFLGAVNTGMEPVDNSTEKCFPIFQRWYIDECFNNIDQHNQIFICTHHGDFKDPSNLCKLVSEINNRIDVKWRSPQHILEKMGCVASEIEDLETASPPGLKTRLKIHARRVLTEFRDNYLEKSETLSMVVNSAKGVVKKVVA